MDNLKLSEENNTLVYANNVESTGVGIDSEVMSADIGTYSGLAEEIGHGRDIKLQHAYYTYDTGNTIEITVDNSVIDGKGAVIDMAGSNIRAFTVSAFSVTFKNLTIKNSNSDNCGVGVISSQTGNGGAIFFSQTGNVENCNFTSNKALFDGGAIWFSGNGVVTNCNFINNIASVIGGAIHFNDFGTVTNCNFTSNNADYEGGAIWFSGNGVVTNCNFTDNNVNRYNGGAVYFHGDGDVVNCNFTDNNAHKGGAIYFYDNGTVLNCNFIDNSASNTGGAIQFNGNGNVSNCIFSSNSANQGGAIFSQVYNKVTVDTCIFKTSYDTTQHAKPCNGLINPRLSIRVIEGSYAATIKITTNNTYNGEVTLIFAGKNYAVALVNGEGSFNVSGLRVEGIYAAAVIFNQTDVFQSTSKTIFFTVNSRLNPKLNINIGEVIEGSNATIKITTDNTYNGEVTVTIGDKNYIVEIINGEGSCNVSDLKAGTYTATVILNQTEVFQSASKTEFFMVHGILKGIPISSELDVSVGDVVIEGSNATIMITTNNTYNGEVTLIIGDVYYTVALVNGVGSCNILGLKAGTYTATIILQQTEAFQATSKTVNFTVKNKEVQILPVPELKISVGDVIEGSNATITITTNNTYKGELTIIISDENYIVRSVRTVALVDGRVSCNFTRLKAGTYTATIILQQTEAFQATSKTINFTVKSKPIIKSSAVTTTYATSKNIIITLTDTQGNILVGKKVNVVLNSVSKILTTNNKGQCILATGTTLIPKTYKVSFKFTGDNMYLASSGSVNLVVKKSTPKITAKNKKYKAKTKNKKYTITLKNDKKQAIKNVKLTLKVNGKTYTAKTNNKGKAIFEIKKLTKKGKYKTTITFKENKYYNKIATKTTLTIK